MTANEPIIICPKCKTEIKLTELLAAPLIEATRQEYERRISQTRADVAKREAAIYEQQEALAKARETIDEQIVIKLRGERRKSPQRKPKKSGLFWRGTLNRKQRKSQTSNKSWMTATKNWLRPKLPKQISFVNSENWTTPNANWS